MATLNNVTTSTTTSTSSNNEREGSIFINYKDEVKNFSKIGYFNLVESLVEGKSRTLLETFTDFKDSINTRLEKDEYEIVKCSSNTNYYIRRKGLTSKGKNFAVIAFIHPSDDFDLSRSSEWTINYVESFVDAEDEDI